MAFFQGYGGTLTSFAKLVLCLREFLGKLVLAAIFLFSARKDNYFLNFLYFLKINNINLYLNFLLITYTGQLLKGQCHEKSFQTETVGV